MKTVKDLGALVKIDHPKYRSLSDIEAGRQVQKEYPGSYDDYLDISNKVADLLSYYDPKAGRLSAWWRRGKSESRGKLQEALTTELSSILEQGAMLEEAALSSERKKAELQAFIIQNEYAFFELKQKSYLWEQAVSEGLTPEGMESRNLERDRSERYIREQAAFSENRIREKEAEAQTHYLIQKMLSDLKVAEFQHMEAIKLDNLIKERQEIVRLALISEYLTPHQRISLTQELVDGLYDQISKINRSTDDEYTKRRKTEDREEIIRYFKGYRDAEGNRLLETD